MNFFYLKTFLLFFAFFCLFGLGVKAEILNENCEKIKLSSGLFQLSCSTQARFIQDREGNWKDFNKAVFFNFVETEKKWVAEFEEERIEIIPFIFYQNRKYNLSEVPAPVLNSLKFSHSILTNQSFFKFSFSLAQISGLSKIGFTLISSQPFTEVDSENWFFLSKKIGVSFSDLLENFSLNYKKISEREIEVIINELPSIAPVLNFDPTIQQKQNSWDMQATRRTRCFEEGCTNIYFCPSSSINPWRVGTSGTATDFYYYRAYYEWSNLDLPSNAIIQDVNVELEVLLKTGSPEGRIFSVSEKPSTKNCTDGSLFDLIDGEFEYVHFLSWRAPVYWEKRDLSEQAVQDLQAHLGWFGFGVASNIFIDGSSNYVGLGNTIKHHGAKLNVVYSLRKTEDNFLILKQVEKNTYFLKKNIFWLVLAFLFCFLVLIIILR